MEHDIIEGCFRTITATDVCGADDRGIVQKKT